MSAATALVRFSGLTPRAATDEVSVGRVRVFGTRAWMAYRRDEHEWNRRGDAPPILGLDQLDALMNLPAGIPVPAASVGAADRRLLYRVPAGSVEWFGSTVTRRAVPPLTPMLAMVRSTEWLDGLKAASRFASYCRRLVIVSALPANADAALAQASFYGIGVAVAAGANQQIVLEPEPLMDWQPTPAWWWFTEEIYQQVRLRV